MLSDKSQMDFEDGGGEPGICPYCGGFLSYGKKFEDKIGLIYPWTCDECGKQGNETYELSFTGHYHK